MVNKNVLIGKLTPFVGKKNVVQYNQDANDIIAGILNTHEKYKSEYDKIYQYFIGNDLEETTYNIWNFLKSNVPYFIEPEETQYLKSPSGILSTKSDCKSYALFSNGILDAIRRNEGWDFDIMYRFASYDPFDKTPQHVFSVINDRNGEIWIDPVLDSYNQKKQPSYYKDKKIKNMALVALSGIGQYDPLLGYDPSLVTSTAESTTASSNWFDSILNALPAVLKAIPQQQPQTGYNSQYAPYYGTPTTTNTSSTGISTNTLLMIGAIGIGAFLLLRKK